jgi:hypothetical protein
MTIKRLTITIADWRFGLQTANLPMIDRNRQSSFLNRQWICPQDADGGRAEVRPYLMHEHNG